MCVKNIDLSVIKASDALPPVHLWKPELCGEMDLVIRANGDWVHEGSLMKRASMRKMFSRILWKEEGEYYLVTPHEKVRIQVEDAPFLVTQSHKGISTQIASGESEVACDSIIFTTSTEDVMALGKDCDLWIEEGEDGARPYISMRYGMKAMLHRHVFYDLVSQGFEREINGRQHICIKSAGKTFSLGAFD